MLFYQRITNLGEQEMIYLSLSPSAKQYKKLKENLMNKTNSELKALTNEQKEQNLKDYIDKCEKKGHVVINTGFSGLEEYDLNDMVYSQPVEGLLYDLNRLPEVIWGFIKDPKWINDYAVYLVIKKLHADNTSLRQQAKDWREVADGLFENNEEFEVCARYQDLLKKYGEKDE
jgi:hypothetical protein